MHICLRLNELHILYQISLSTEIRWKMTQLSWNFNGCYFSSLQIKWISFVWTLKKKKKELEFHSRETILCVYLSHIASNIVGQHVKHKRKRRKYGNAKHTIPNGILCFVFEDFSCVSCSVYICLLLVKQWANLCSKMENCTRKMTSVVRQIKRSSE